MSAADAHAVPPGWDGNPSLWRRRAPVIALASAGCAISLYLGLFQLDVLATVWEPFFGDGSRVVLESELSHILPVPDALLGALVYLIDVVTGSIGGTDRWRRMPWVVILFGLAVGPLGLVSIVLVIVQPVVYGAFCTLCLASAIISLSLIALAMDEVLATLQLLRRAHDDGRPVWRVVRHGDTRPSEA